MSLLQNKTADEQLIALQQGNEKAIGYFFSKYYHALVYYSHTITASKEFAEEVAADAFIKLWDRHDRFFAENSLRSFLFLVVRNASFNFKKAGKKEATAITDYGLYINDAQSNDFELLVRSETYNEVFQAIKALPKRYQTIFEQFYLEGKTYPEIAAHLNTTINNVRIQKMRALMLLRKKLPFTIFISFALQALRSFL